MEYDVTIENKGNLDAKLNDILVNKQNAIEEAVIITFTGYKEGEILKANQSKIVHVKIEYNPNYKGEETSSEVNVNFDFTQESSSPDKPNTYVLTYDYQTNGGTRTDSEGIYLTSGADVDLTVKAYKDGWTFLGWNTDKNAKEALTNYKMPEGASTLYAIYKKDLTITFQMGNNIANIGKNQETCSIFNNETSCEITLPTITPQEGFISVGWSTTINDTQGIEAGTKLTLINNITYYANAIDNGVPQITISPNEQTTYIAGGKEVTVDITDIASGLKANQEISYAWSTSNTTVPTFTNKIPLNNAEGAKTAQITIPTTASETLTGSYYLWINGGISDTTGNISTTKISGVFKFDNKEPTLTISTSATTNSITVVAATTSESGITKYEYSKDGGQKWIDGGTSNTYKFENLSQGTYNIAVRITNGVGKTVTNNKEQATAVLQTPTFEESGVYPKIVTITYPDGCGENLTCTYQKDNGTVTEVTTKTVDVSFDNHGSVVANVSDGINTLNPVYNVKIELTASDLSYSNANTGLNCQDVQCALDEIKKMLN